MRHWLLALRLFLAGGLLTIGDADAARRMGGGRSIGMQRNDTPPAQAPAPAASPGASAGAAAAAQPARNRWLGPVAGLAAGLGLAALFSHLGLGEGFGSFVMLLLILAAAYFLFRMLRRSSQGQAPVQYAGGPTGFAPRPTGTEMPLGAAAAKAGATPAGFDAEGFLRQARVNFVRLQAAHDSGNLEDIRQFATPEVFAEVTLDIKSRSGGAQQTEVLVLDPELLDVSEEGRQYVASVRFHGSLRADAAPAPFDETWHLTKPVDGSRGWQVAGIQQNA